MENSWEVIKEKAIQQLEKECQIFVRKLERIRSNQISLETIRGLTINYQGEKIPLKKITNLRISPSQELIVQVFEPKLISLIIEPVKQQGYKLAGNTKTEAYFTLSSSGETREKLIRDVRTITEEGKIALRRVRQEIRDLIKKNSSFSQDQKRNYEIQTDRIIKDYQDKLTTAEGKKIQELGKV